MFRIPWRKRRSQLYFLYTLAAPSSQRGIYFLLVDVNLSPRFYRLIFRLPGRKMLRLSLPLRLRVMMTWKNTWFLPPLHIQEKSLSFEIRTSLWYACCMLHRWAAGIDHWRKLCMNRTLKKVSAYRASWLRDHTILGHKKSHIESLVHDQFFFVAFLRHRFTEAFRVEISAGWTAQDSRQVVASHRPYPRHEHLFDTTLRFL